jgi:hypothetical protein
VLSVLLFLIASFIKPPEDALLHFDAKDKATGTDPAAICDNIKVVSFGSEAPTWEKRLRHGCVTNIRDHGESMLHVVLATLPKAMFVFLPLIAFLHMLVYWWPRSRYAEHLLFFVHLHAFFFAAIAVMLLVKGVADVWQPAATFSNVAGSLLGWAMAAYTVVAIKRVFARGWVNTLLKSAGLFLVYAVTFAVTIGAVFIYAWMQV